MTRHIHLHIHRTVDSFVHRAQTRDAFVETQHPRGQPKNAGEFTKKGTTTPKASPTPKPSPARVSSSSASSGPRSHLPGGTNKVEMRPLPQDRAQWPDHIKKLIIPPAWTDKQYNPDPKGEKLVTGHDVKGRLQSLYSEKHNKQKKADKFLRIKKMLPNKEKYAAKNNKNLSSRDQGIKQHAEALGLIMATGIRPGSERDTGADVQAYGITTMQGQHVVSEGQKTYLRFVGKKGVSQNLEIVDQQLAAALKERAKRVGPTAEVFPSVTDNSLRRYTKGVTNGLANPKDFRTLHGTSLAYAKIKSMQEPKTKAELKKAMKEVATLVSSQLGNTPAVALNSYISPYVWADWKITQ
jgi:DNA topoisomerase-1